MTTNRSTYRRALAALAISLCSGEAAAIRRDPAKRTADLLRRVFGAS